MLRVDNFAAMLGPIAGRVAWLFAQARNALFAYSPTTAALSVLYAAAAKQVDERLLDDHLIVPIATPWPPHHGMATDRSFGRALWEWSDRTCRAASGRRRARAG